MALPIQTENKLVVAKGKDNGNREGQKVGQSFISGKWDVLEIVAVAAKSPNQVNSLVGDILIWSLYLNKYYSSYAMFLQN